MQSLTNSIHLEKCPVRLDELMACFEAHHIISMGDSVEARFRIKGIVQIEILKKHRRIKTLRD